MISGFRSFRGRLATSVTVLIGAFAASSCGRHMPDPQHTPDNGAGAVIGSGAQQPLPQGSTTHAIGEEDGGYVPPSYNGGSATTLAVGEEDGGTATTLAIGEEDGGSPLPAYDSGTATTLAIGEEDGGYVPPSYDDELATTLAVGEEDGSGPIPVEPNGGIGDGAGPPPDIITTFAVGEETGTTY